MALMNLREVEQSIKTLEEQVESLQLLTKTQQHEIIVLKSFIDETISYYRNQRFSSLSEITNQAIEQDIRSCLDTIFQYYKDDLNVEKLLIETFKPIKLHSFEQHELIKRMNELLSQKNILVAFLEQEIILNEYLDDYIDYCDYYLKIPEQKVYRRYQEHLKAIKKHMKTLKPKIETSKQTIKDLVTIIKKHLGIK